MKNYIQHFSLICASVFSLQAFAEGGSLFDVNSVGQTVNISAVANNLYPGAGIKITTPGYRIIDEHVCKSRDNGFCVFTLKHRESTAFVLDGPAGFIDLELCLNAVGHLSCQIFNHVKITHMPRNLYITNNAFNDGLIAKKLDGDEPSAVYRCELSEETGEVLHNRCHYTAYGTDMNDYEGIAIHPSGRKAYLTQAYTGNSNVYNCPIEHDGRMGTCTPTAVTLQSGGATSFYPYYGMAAVNSAGTLAFFPGYFSPPGTATLAICPIGFHEEVEGNCVNTGVNLSNYLTGIAVSQDDRRAYIANYTESSQGTVSVCDSESLFLNCFNKIGGGSITFGADLGGVALSNPFGNTLYVVDNTNSVVYACDTERTHSDHFRNCVNALSSPSTINNIWSIAVNAADSLAYIVTYNDGGLRANHTVSNNYLYTCPIIHGGPNDGTFGTCTSTLLPSSLLPYGIALGY